ncbi:MULTISPECIES: hypothetical protein [unclassified Dyella]|uniref:hypothetical protein n=1 Tax=Dyella sp. ASV21 TaxID=2795114 RepID=UPI0018ED4044|nr:MULTISPECIES: hypothetical protein [unclassified Dyella]
MSTSIDRVALSALLLVASMGCSAQSVTLSQAFELCAKSVKGVSYDAQTGIDAGVIHAGKAGAKVTIYVGQHPDIPPGMNIQRDRTRYVPRDLGPTLQYIAQSARANGHGTVRLYGYDRAVNDQILVLVSADDGAANLALVRSIGDSLMRCPTQ